jgi:hypothetical protein
MKAVPAYKESEAQLQTACVQLGRYMGFYCERLNSGQYPMGEGRFKRYIRGVAAGTPDYLFLKYGRAFFMEYKAGKNKPTTLQTEKMKELNEYGCPCYVIHSVEEQKAVLKAIDSICGPV